MKKKGFTLIELLAVILILAIIAIIAIPAVLNVVEDSKKAAAEASARNIINAAETHYVKEIMQGIKVSKIDLTKGVLKYDGDQAEIGYVSLDDNGKGSGKMYISGYCVTAVSKSEISSEKVDIEDCEIDDAEGPLTYANGTAIYYNPETNMKCTEAEASANTSKNKGCLKWYTFLDEGSDFINLILSHNSSGNINWVTKEDYIASGGTEDAWSTWETEMTPITASKQLKVDTETWSADAKNTARMITAAE